MQISYKPKAFQAAKSIGVYLGSFDPFHKGHQWAVERLAERFDGILLLIPAIHFEKNNRFPLNATFQQRLMMIQATLKGKNNAVGLGLAEEVLFIRLLNELSSIFPKADIAYGMGNETYQKLLFSETYYQRMGCEWTLEDAKKLALIKEKVVVFGRSQSDSRFLYVPDNIASISSTDVRNKVKALRHQNAGFAQWRQTLETLISHEAVAYIYHEGLYRDA